MKEDTGQQMHSLKLFLDKIVLLAVTAFAITYLYVGVSRVMYPYDIDFIENSMLMQAIQFAEGQPVFVPANADYVPQVYMPLFTWLGGMLFRVFGTSYIPLRGISFVSTLLTAGLLYWIGARISREPLVGLFCAGLFFAGYRTTGGWYELARVDALYVMLSLAGLILAVEYRKRSWGPAAAAAVLALAFLTKQNAPVFAVAAGLYLAMAIGRRSWQFLTVYITIAGAGFAWFELTSRGWFSTYAFGIVYASPIQWSRVWEFFRMDLLRSMLGLTAIAAAAGIFSALRLSVPAGKTTWNSKAGMIVVSARRWALERPWLLFMVLALAVTIAGRASVGGNRNNLMPAYTFMCLAPALVSAELKFRSTRWVPPGRVVLGLLILGQLGLTLVFPRYPTGFIPTREMREAGDRFVERIAGLEGEVLVMMHPYYALLAGKEPAVHIQMLYHARWRARDPLPQDFVDRFEHQYYHWIISDESAYFETEPALQKLLNTYYEPVEQLGPNEAPPTITGMVVRPQVIYAPKK